MSDKVAGVINTDRLTRWVKRVLWMQVIVAAMAITVNYLEYGLLADFLNGVYTSQDRAIADAEASDWRKGIINVVGLLVFVVSTVLILRWIHQSNSNARQLGAEHMEFTPGWSIGYYFVPLLHLWKPYQAMSEIWRASNRPSDWKYQVVSWLLPIWWGLWVSSNLLGHYIIKSSRQASEIKELIDLNVVSQVANVIDIPLALVFMAIVSRIHQMQRNQSYIQTTQRLDGPVGLKVIE